MPRSPMKSSVVLKALMALTGVYLLAFVFVHMLGNLPLLLPESIGRPSFNAYAHALTSAPPIKVASGLTYLSVLVHAAVSTALWRKNAKARPLPYATEQRNANSPWYSRSMGLLGAATLAFIVLHMHTFWYRYHWGPIGYDSEGHKDLYEVVVTAFQEPWLVLVHVASIVLLGFHLQHGLAAALRSLGVHGVGFDRIAPRLSKWVAWGLTGPFIIIAIYVFFAFSGSAR